MNRMNRFRSLSVERAETEVLREGVPTYAVLTVDKDGVHIDALTGTPITLPWRTLEIMLSMGAVQEGLAKRTGRELG